MILSAEQEQCKAEVIRWFRNKKDRKPFFYLAGAAGVGKSSATMEIVNSLGVDALFGAPTGKACQVMASKGCPSPRTIHSLIYKPAGLSGRRIEVEKLQDQLKQIDPESDQASTIRRSLERELSDVRPLFILNTDSVIREVDLLVLDECSMIDSTMAQDLLSFGVPILVQADPFQLPPVKAVSYFSKFDPDFILKEVHRQAKESPVLYLATLVREGKRLQLGNYGTSKVVRDIDESDALDHDQIIVGRNKTRHATNNKVRKLKNIDSIFPVAGESVICRKNNHKLGLLNGTHFTVTSCREASPTKLFLGIKNDELDLQVVAHKAWFTGNEESVGPWSQADAETFAFGYSITCHSAQGGQWPSVFVLDQSRDFSNWSSWLYTALSRASDRVTVKL